MSTNVMTIEKTVGKIETRKTRTAKTLTGRQVDERQVDRKAIYNNAFQEMKYLVSKGRTAGDALDIVTVKHRLYAIEKINLMKRHLRAERLTYILCQAIGNTLFKLGARPCCSTAIDEETTTYGYGQLDEYGFWEFPVSSETVERKRRREAIVRARNERREFMREINSLLDDQTGKVGDTLGSLGLSKINQN